MVKFSNSKLNAYYDCSRLYDYIYNKQKSVGSNGYMLRGTAIHEMLEVIYQYYMERNEGLVNRPLSPEHLNLIVLPHPNEDSFPMKAEAGMMVRAYHDHYMLDVDKHFRVLAVEEHIEFPLTTPSGRVVTIEIYVDLILLNLATGKLTIMDHKSGAPWDAMQLKWDAQQALYMAGMNYVGRPVEQIISNNIKGAYRGKMPSVKDSFTRLRLEMSQQRMKGVLHQIGYKIDEILDEDNKFPMTLAKHCKTCQFNTVCDAVLEQDFKRADFLLNALPSKKDSAMLRIGQRRQFLDTLDERKGFYAANVDAPDELHFIGDGDD